MLPIRRKVGNHCTGEANRHRAVVFAVGSTTLTFVDDGELKVSPSSCKAGATATRAARRTGTVTAATTTVVAAAAATATLPNVSVTSVHVGARRWARATNSTHAWASTS